MSNETLHPVARAAALYHDQIRDFGPECNSLEARYDLIH
jgi:hypothetical protein